jgi:hypothetical protein
MTSSEAGRKDTALLLALVGTVGVGLVVTAVHVSSFAFLLWDDDNILRWLAARDTGSRFEWMVDPAATTAVIPVSAAAWAFVADAAGISPRSLHLFQILLHVLCVVLAALTCVGVLRVVPSTRPASSRLGWIAGVAAAGLWGLAPARAEPVGWVAATPYPLATALALVSILLFLRAGTGRDMRARALLLGAGATFALSALAHPLTVTAFVAFPALAYLRSRPANAVDAGRDAFLPIWLAAVAGVAASVAAATVGSFSENAPAAWPAPGPLVQVERFLGLAGRWGLLQAWLPLPRPDGDYTQTSWQTPGFIVGVACLASVLGWGWMRARAGRPGLLTAAACHLAIALPVSGPGARHHIHSDRYTYALSVVGAVVLAWALREGMARLANRATARFLAVATTIGLLAGSAAGLQTALQPWRDTATLMEHFIAVAPEIESRLFAAVRLGEHWRAHGDAGRARDAVLRIPDLPSGPEPERIPRVIRWLVRGGYCAEARTIEEVRGAALPREAREAAAVALLDCVR